MYKLYILKELQAVTYIALLRFKINRTHAVSCNACDVRETQSSTERLAYCAPFAFILSKNIPL